ncbi:MAG: response regulator transcription factor [Chloroflexi bacterium]|nr:response regulator transcription factor [Chloroflexota bacterium]MDA8189717.1 response regulator transcription factor [Dehalococcoidales bacterium]
MRILVVEDEHKLAAVLKRGLQEHGYAVDVAHDGEDGFSFAEIGEHDLIILDIMLPSLDGFEIARKLRARRMNTPILMLTARDAVDDRVRGLDSGADDYLIKPFAFRELVARVRALLRRDELVKDPVLRVADLEVDTISHEVRRSGQMISLTSKEYAVLEYLVRNPNRVLTRAQIAEHVWDYDFTAMSNVVDVYIRYLRRKLDDGFEPKLLHTIRGTGYQLKVPR